MRTMRNAITNAADAIIDLCDRNSFSPAIFGNYLTSSGRGFHTNLLKAFLGFVQAMDMIYENKQYDVQNMKAAVVCHEIKQMLTSKYGWPIDFNN